MSVGITTALVVGLMSDDQSAEGYKGILDESQFAKFLIENAVFELVLLPLAFVGKGLSAASNYLAKRAVKQSIAYAGKFIARQALKQTIKQIGAQTAREIGKTALKQSMRYAVNLVFQTAKFLITHPNAIFTNLAFIGIKGMGMLFRVGAGLGANVGARIAQSAAGVFVKSLFAGARSLIATGLRIAGGAVKAQLYKRLGNKVAFALIQFASNVKSGLARAFTNMGQRMGRSIMSKVTIWWSYRERCSYLGNSQFIGYDCWSGTIWFNGIEHYGYITF